MSFSLSVKNELAKIALSDVSEVIAEIAGMVPMCASLKMRMRDIDVYFNTENASVARRIFTFLKNFYSSDVEVKVSKSRQLKKNNYYSVVLKDSGASRVLLYDIEFIRGENVFIPTYTPMFILRDDEAKRAYIRGCFLGAGSISNPEKHYHMEFVSNNERHANYLKNIINQYGFNSKIVARKQNYIVYIKEAEQISDLLSLMGAQNSMLQFENVRVVKDINNNVNRIVNLENANLSKIVNSSVKQVIDIEYIKERIGLDALPESLREVAELRLEDDTMSLKELGQRLNPPIGKSGVNHRLNKIKDIANKLRSE